MENEAVIGAFSDEHAACITGVSLNQLREWDSAGFFKPSYGTKRAHVPYGRIYSFRDLVALQVLNDLRNEKRIPLQHLKAVSAKLAHLGDERWTATTLYVLGKRVVFEDPNTFEREEIVSRQRVFNIPLRVVIRSTKKRIAELNDRSGSVGKIERRRYVAQNVPVFAGTRVPVSTVLDFVAAGYSIPDIIQEFPGLKPEDIEFAMLEQERSAA